MQHLDEGTIHAWLDGQLPRDEAARVEAHVAECRECADAVAEARGLIAASSRILTALDDVPRVGSANRHQPFSPEGGAAPLTEEQAPARERARRRWFSAPSLAAAAAIVVAVGTLTLMRVGAKDQLTSEPQAERLEQTAASAADTDATPAIASEATPNAAPTSAAANAVAAANEAAPRRALADRARREAAPPPVVPIAPPSVAGDRAVVSVDSARLAMKQSIGNARAAALSRAMPAQQTPAESKDQRASADQRDEQLAKAQAAVAAPAPAPRPDTAAVTVIRGRDAGQQRFLADSARQPAAKAANAVSATGVVSGRVTDGNNTALSTVLVTVVGTNIGVTTTESGQFELRGVPVGTQRVLARRIGFSAKTDSVTVTAGQATTLDVRLTPSPANLENVVVTGAASATRRATVGSTIAPAAPAAGQQGQSTTAVGCYDVSITPATPQSRNGFRQVPRRLALDSTVVPGRTDGVWYQVRDVARTGGTAGNGVWRPTTPDAIEAQWIYGTRTGTLRLTGVPGPVLRGSLEEVDRATGVGEAGVVVAAKVRCGS